MTTLDLAREENQCRAADLHAAKQRLLDAETGVKMMQERYSESQAALIRELEKQPAKRSHKAKQKEESK